MVERVLCMDEAEGSIPFTSKEKARLAQLVRASL